MNHKFKYKRGDTLYYDDELNNDFADNKIKQKPLDPNYKFLKIDLWWRFWSAFVYYCFAIPILGLVGYLTRSVRVSGRKNLKELKKTGYFVYSNHTQDIVDGFMNQVYICRPKRSYIIAHRDAVSIKGIKTLVELIGAIPVPTNIHQMKSFAETIDYRIKQGATVVIFPEAHIWPFYNKIRNFEATSFRYPARLNVPIVCTVVTYRRRKIFKNFKPYMNITVSKPIYPKDGLSPRENQEYLRNEAYRVMCDIVEKQGSYGHYNYVFKEKENS